MNNFCKNIGYDELCEAIANRESCQGIKYVELVRHAIADADFAEFIWNKWQIDVFSL